MEYQTLLLEISEGIATVTVNRPQSLNALNSEVLRELECLFYELERNNGVQVVILTGAGEKAFVAGADIKEMVEFNACQGHSFSRQGQLAMLAMEKMRKPVIAAVNGFALGGGA